MPFFGLFKPSPQQLLIEALYTQIVAAGRRPEWYGPNRLSDSPGGRFEGLVLAAAPVFLRLKAPDAEPIAARFADRFFLGLDDGLRELGIGDLSVPKKMKRLAGRVYGRLQAYEAALSQSQPALAQAIADNALAGEDNGAFAASLAAWLADHAQRFAAAPVSAMAEAQSWRAP